MFLITSIFIEIVFVIIFVSTFIAIIRKAKSNPNSTLKSDEETTTFQNTISNANDPYSYGNSLSSEPTDIYCDYCGSKFNKNKKRCPSCGARTQK